MAEKEYIEREKLNDMLEDFCVNESFYDALQTIPTAEAVPVRHGRWIIIETLCGGGKETKYCRCSECNKANVIRSNYCPNCGAKMGGDPNE